MRGPVDSSRPIGTSDPVRLGRPGGNSSRPASLGAGASGRGCQPYRLTAPVRLCSRPARRYHEPPPGSVPIYEPRGRRIAEEPPGRGSLRRGLSDPESEGPRGGHPSPAKNSLSTRGPSAASLTWRQVLPTAFPTLRTRRLSCRLGGNDRLNGPRLDTRTTAIGRESESPPTSPPHRGTLARGAGPPLPDRSVTCPRCTDPPGLT
jgi:hypothetical protein